jgi:DNA-binding response OmpR family regulator
VLKSIRETAGMKPMPVVMLTSSKEEQDLVRSYELGVNAYVVKPVDFTEFVRAISDLGIFWAVLNEPPPGSYRYVKPVK